MSHVYPCFNNIRLLTSVIILSVLIFSPLPAEEIDIQVLGTYEGSFLAGDIAVRNGYAFIAGGDRVEIVNVTNANAPQLVTRITTSALGLAIKGSYLYVVGGYGFEVYNITNSSAPVFVTARDTGRYNEVDAAWATQVRIEGDYAYVIYEYNYYDEEEWLDLNWGGLEVIDISNPSQPTFRGYYGEFPYDDWAPFYYGRIDVKQAYVYMENSDGDIEVIDATNPDYPYLCQSYPWMGSGDGNFYIDGDIAFYSGYSTTAYDVTDPANPVETWLEIYTTGAICAQGERLYLRTAYGEPIFITCFDVFDYDWPQVLGAHPLASSGGYSQDIVLQGDRLYSLIPNELSIIDVATPAGLQTVGAVDSGGNTVAVRDNLAWVTSMGLAAYDVTIPSDPWQIGSYSTNAMARSVARYGSYALVAKSEDGLQIINVTDPENPELVSYIESQDFMRQVTVSGTKAYIADGRGGARIIDISDPLHPQLLGTCLPEGNVSQVAVSGNLAFLCASSGPTGSLGMYIYDIENPSEPVLLSFWNQDRGVRCFALKGNYVFAAVWTGIDVIDVSAPQTPVLVGHYHNSWDFQALAVEGDYLYARTSVQLFVVNIANPANPTEVSNIWPGSSSGKMTVAGNLIYITSGLLSTKGVEIISVADKTKPVIVGTYDTKDVALDVIPVGTDLWVANGRGGFLVLNASNTSAIQQRGVYDDSGEAMDVALKDDYAFVAARETGLHIVDIANPITTVLSKRYRRVSRYDTAGDARAVAVSGDYVYIADGTNGLVVLYVYNPENPVLAGSLDTIGNAIDVTVLGQYAYVADEQAGLHVVKISTPGNPVLSGTYRTAGTAQGVALADGYAFVADGDNGLVIVDVHNPAFPRFISDLALTGDSCAVALDGSTAYVAALEGGVHVVDISTITAPRRSGGNGVYKAREVTVNDHYVYVVGTSSLNECQLSGFVVLYPK
jgi:hypothetical protein